MVEFHEECPRCRAVARSARVQRPAVACCGAGVIMLPWAVLPPIAKTFRRMSPRSSTSCRTATSQQSISPIPLTERLPSYSFFSMFNTALY